MPDKPPSKHPELNILLKLLNLGSVILVLGLLGFWLDHTLTTLPLYTAIGILLGVCYSFYEAWQIYHQE